jgi:hypothetical protein
MGLLVGPALAAHGAVVEPKPLRATGSVIYTQWGGGTKSVRSSIDNLGGGVIQVTQAADDFVVPSYADSWSISAVEVAGSKQGSAELSSINVFFYSNSSNKPGELVSGQPSQQSIPPSKIENLSTGNYVINLNTPVQLGPGTYWVSVQIVPPAINYDWMWYTRLAQTNNPSAWRNPDGNQYMGCPVWGYRLPTCSNYGSPDVDMQFRLWGSVVQPALGGMPSRLRFYYSTDGSGMLFPASFKLRPAETGGSVKELTWSVSSGDARFSLQTPAGQTPNGTFSITPTDIGSSYSAAVTVSTSDPAVVQNSPFVITVSLDVVDWPFNFVNLPLVSK